VLPAEGIGLALRLTGAGACVLVLPGALLLRSLGGVWGVGVAAAASLALSLAVVALASALVFAAGSSLSLAVAVLGCFLVAAMAVDLGARRRDGAWALPWPRRRGEQVVLGLGILAIVAFTGVVWWAAGPPEGDTLGHLARVRKLAELGDLRGLKSVDEFADGGLHPGYAFPLWHAADAMVARLAGVDPALVMRYLSVLLVPLAILVSYGAGQSLFRSRTGGLAVAAFQVAQLGLSRGGVGSFLTLTNPASAGRVLLFPMVLALGFAVVNGGGVAAGLAVAAGSFALVAVHPTYALYAALALGAFLVVRLLVAPRGLRDLPRLAVTLGLVLVPVAAFVAWLAPVIRSTASVSPDAQEKARAFGHYATQVVGSPDAFHMSPSVLTRGGPVVVAGLLAVALAVLSPRRRWAAYVLGATAAMLAVLLWTPLFTRLSDAVSLSQSRRLGSFLPIPFALAGAALLAGRLRMFAPVASLAAGVAAELGFSGDFGYKVAQPGPAWPVWVALVGAVGGIAVAAVARGRWNVRAGGAVWAALAVVVFVLPIAVSGLRSVEKDTTTSSFALPPSVVRELRSLPPRSVLFSTLEASYYAAADAPLWIAAAPPGHVADTPENRPYARRRDVLRFFSDPRTTPAERRAILSRYDVSWILADKQRRWPERFLASYPVVFSGPRYVLYRVEQ
jgi:hypothetical protein